MATEYSAVPSDEHGGVKTRPGTVLSPLLITAAALFTLVFGAACFVLGMAMAGNGNAAAGTRQNLNGLLPPQAFVPQIPSKEVVFDFPTKYEDKGPAGDKLWNDLMPAGAGFIRVPNPRRFDMPASEPIDGDAEQAEIYSLSVTHSIHCLAVLRDVIIKYEKRDMSRFAGNGHEYHCLDYIRQSVVCAGDTTLDYADEHVYGKVIRYGFTGNNSTHVCRDWDAIKAFAEDNKAGDRSGVFR